MTKNQIKKVAPGTQGLPRAVSMLLGPGAAPNKIEVKQ